MYHSQEAYASGSSHLACFPFYVSNASASADNSADNVVNKYLLYVTEQVTGSLETMSAGSTFEIVVEEAPVTGSGEDLESDKHFKN
jgi:hypothetical protein